MRRELPAIRFRQWLADWDQVTFDEGNERAKPDEHILLFSMKANELRALSEPFRRRRDHADAAPVGIQRNLDTERSELIRDYVRYGYPYSEMSEGRRKKYDLDDLRKPGWLPTAIIVNILKDADTRRSRSVDSNDLIGVEHGEATAKLTLPLGFQPDEGWQPKSLPPIEIIDGQHRLFAFDPDQELPGDFELPVVAFHGLDIGWQAYLFWTINISPKKINRSHAFDLYPLLRTQDWLEKFDEAVVYREARAQELTDFLYSHPDSVWRDRVNMLGEGRDKGRVSQAGWIRTLIGTVLAARGKSGGIFGANIGYANSPLPWSRAQQAAFLLTVWAEFLNALLQTDAPWAKSLRQDTLPIEGNPVDDIAFSGPHTLLNQEQGIRGVLTVVNDFFVSRADEFALADWIMPSAEGASTTDQMITDAIVTLRDEPAIEGIRELVAVLAAFDWRSSDAPRLSEQEKRNKQAYRGSSGYGVLRTDLYTYLSNVGGGIGNVFEPLRAQQ